MHDQFQAHLAAHGRFAKDGLDVEQAQAPHFQQVLQQGRAAAFDHVGRDAREFDGVIGHQAVAARNQFQAQLALAQARIARDQHTHAQHVHEHAMHDDALRQLFGQVDAQEIDHLRGRQRGREQGNVLLVADGEDVGRRFQPLRDDQRGWAAGDQFTDHMRARVDLQALIIIDFLVTEDLDTARMDQVQVAHLVGGRRDIARDQALAAGETGEPAQLQTFTIIVVQALYRQRRLQHGSLLQEWRNT